MSTALPPRPRQISQTTAHVTIVASIYNQEFTDALVANACDELQSIMPNVRLDIIRVPGAFEIPVACSAIMHSQNPPQALITLGLIIRGKTQHGDLVAESVTTSLQQLAVATKIPVIHEVLLVENAEQAHDRCIGEELNRGREAARSAYTMLELFSKLGLSNSGKSSIRTYPSNA